MKNFYNLVNNKRILFLIYGLAFIIVAGIIFALYRSGKLGFRADVTTPGTVINTVTLTYSDSQNQTRTAKSNTVGTQILPPLSPPVITSVAAAGCSNTKLGWTEPSPPASKYLIYRDGKKIAEVNPGTKYLIEYFNDFYYFNNPQSQLDPNYTQNLTYGIVSVNSSGQQSSMNIKSLSLKHNTICGRTDRVIKGYKVLSFKNISVVKNSDTNYTINWETDSSASTQQVAYGDTQDMGNLSAVISNSDTVNLKRSYSITLPKALGTGEYYYFNIATLFYRYMDFSEVKKFDKNGAITDVPISLFHTTDNSTPTPSPTPAPTSESTPTQDTTNNTNTTPTPTPTPTITPTPTPNTTTPPTATPTVVPPGETTTAYASVSGIATDAQKTPIADATVEIKDGNKTIVSTQTDKNGYYSISDSNIKDKNYTLEISKDDGKYQGSSKIKVGSKDSSVVKNIEIKKVNFFLKIWNSIISILWRR